MNADSIGARANLPWITVKRIRMLRGIGISPLDAINVEFDGLYI
jgi:hypothetical protein